MPSSPASPASFRPALHSLLPRPLPAPVESAVERLLGLDRLHRVYDAARLDPASIFDRLLHLLGVRVDVSPSDLARIPAAGPVVAVANHPFGLLEGPILGSLLLPLRPDLRILANSLLGAAPEISRYCILVNPFGGPAAARANVRSLKDSIAWLRNGGLLAAFPAGEVAHMDLRLRAIADPAWNPSIARIIRLTAATVVPIHFHGANSALFQILGLIHPRLRTALLPHEFLNKRRASVSVRIGHPIPPAQLAAFADDPGLTAHLRRRTYALAPVARPAAPLRLPIPRRPASAPVPVAAPRSLHILESEIRALPPDRLLAEQGPLAALWSRISETPTVIDEIGRLRELTFRAAGEGTGKASDIDPFDTSYTHLFVWNRETREIAAAYRLAFVPEILASSGLRGLYTNTVFSYGSAFLDQIGPAVELGRSFVRAEYQRSYAPLLLLWKGIGALVAAHPSARVLFGPVSISNDYSPASRELIVRFLSAYCRADGLTPLVRARNPFHHHRPGPQDPLAGASSIDDLSALVADIETDGKGVPVLLRQYLKLGGKLVCFNVDRDFADSLDGLIVVDLLETDPRVLDRYMGKDPARAFLARHAPAATPAR